MVTRTARSIVGFLAAVSCGVAFVASLPAAEQSDVRHVIRDARIVTMAGPLLERGTIVMRDGLIEEVGATVAVPPEAVVIEGAGLTVYPGLIDMANATAVETPEAAAPTGARGTGGGGTASLEDQERTRRIALLRPEFETARAVRVEGPEMRRLASAGITSVLAVPSAGLIRGQSAFINVMAPPGAAHIGVIADYRRGLVVVKSPVAQHFSFSAGGARGGGYPGALLGTIAFVRQALHDAKWQRDARGYVERHPDRPRPLLEPSLDALAPVIDGRLPAAFDADLAVEISRALDLAKEFTLDPLIIGGAESGNVAADIRAARGRVIYSLDFPVAPPAGRGGRGGAAADETMRAIRARQNAPKAPAALQAAGVPFAFTSGGLEDLSLFLRNAARTVSEGGLAAEAALTALTIGAARIAGVDNRLGTIQKGRIGNVIVTDGDWLNEKARIRHVFIDGRPIEIDPPSTTPAGGGRRGGGGGRGAPPQP